MSHRFNKKNKKKEKPETKFSGPSPDRVAEATSDILLSARKYPCLLCNGKPVAAALFIPTPEFMEKTGKKSKFVGGQLMLAYSLCESCIALPNRMELVETAFANADSACETRYLTDDPKYN